MHSKLILLTLTLCTVTLFIAPYVTALDTDGLVGAIDEVVLYDRALSEKEISELIEDGMLVALDVQPGGKFVTTWSQIKAEKNR